MGTRAGVKRPDLILRNKSKKQRLAVSRGWENENTREARISKIKTYTGKIKATYGHKGKHHSEVSKKIISQKAKGRFANENHPMWAGDKASYSALHKWINGQKKEESLLCANCGKGNNLHWANKDHEYRRNKEDYVRLCAKCHRRYDIENGIYGKGAKFRNKQIN